MLKPEEVTSAIQQEIQKFESKLKMESVGYVLQVGDGISRVYGLDDVQMSEMVEFEDGTTGLVMNLEQDNVGVVILGHDRGIREGTPVKRTGKIMQVPVGDALIGRVVNPLGEPLDGKGPIATDKFRPLEFIPPNVVQRQPVKEPLQTGIKAVDAMIPIGRGQRELIIGDRQTGKTALLVDTIINQKDSGVICVYVAIGQKMSSVVATVKALEDNGAMAHTIVVAASAEDPAPLQYIAPYAGCSMAEEYLYNGGHALIVYDDLSKQAQAYRQLSLLLRRPPGREAYPGDVFYLHSRLLERAAKLHADLGGGSLTALPVIETQAGDVSAYVPTNVISITDGQVYLEPDLFYAGVRPAINVGLSVSRVGGNAQTKAMKQVAGMLRLSLAQYRELAAFSQLSTDLDEGTKKQLTRGACMVELLKQDLFGPMSFTDQVLIIFAGNEGYLDEIPLNLIKAYEKKLIPYIHEKYPGIPAAISKEKAISDAIKAELANAIKKFTVEFNSEKQDAIS